MNPVQFAAHLESPEVLNVLLRYIQAKCSKDSEGEFREKTMKIMHVSAFGKNLMSVILDNKKLFASHSIYHQIESYLHESDKASIGIQKCVQRNLRSSKLSKKHSQCHAKKALSQGIVTFPKDKDGLLRVFVHFVQSFSNCIVRCSDRFSTGEKMHYLLNNAGGFLFLEFPLHNQINHLIQLMITKMKILGMSMWFCSVSWPTNCHFLVGSLS